MTPNEKKESDEPKATDVSTSCRTNEMVPPSQSSQKDASQASAEHGVFDDSYRKKWWKVDLIIACVTICGLVVSGLHVARSKAAIGEPAMPQLVLQAVLSKLLMDLFVWLPASFALRTLLLKKWIGVSDEDYFMIMVNRDRFDLQSLKNAYTEIKIQKWDCSVRKSSHFLYYAFAIVVEAPHVARGNAPAMVFAIVLHSAVVLFARLVVLYCRLFENNLYVQSWLYSAPRIRDGRDADINLRMASTMTWLGTVACSLLLDVTTDCGPGSIEADADVNSPEVIAYKQIVQSMTYLAFTPVALGDAMGEVIGSFYGKHKFAVKGFGEVNKKSLEGCAAVFVFSLLPSLLTTFVLFPEALPGEAYGAKLWLPLGVAALSTLAETAAFRSTDNCVIPVCNALPILLVYTAVNDMC